MALTLSLKQHIRTVPRGLMFTIKRICTGLQLRILFFFDHEFTAVCLIMMMRLYTYTYKQDSSSGSPADPDVDIDGTPDEHSMRSHALSPSLPRLLSFPMGSEGVLDCVCRVRTHRSQPDLAQSAESSAAWTGEPL